MRKTNEEKAATNVSRRHFMTTAGLAAAGGVLVSGAMAVGAVPKTEPLSVPEAGKWPWVKLDPQEAAERAYKNYHAKDG